MCKVIKGLMNYSPIRHNNNMETEKKDKEDIQFLYPPRDNVYDKKNLRLTTIELDKDVVNGMINIANELLNTK